MTDLIERLRREAESDMVPMDRAMQLMLEAADALEEAQAEREVIGAEAVKYAGKSGRLEAKVERMAEALRLIASPKRPDGTWNRDREACRQIAENALRDHDQEGKE